MKIDSVSVFAGRTYNIVEQRTYQGEALGDNYGICFLIA